MGTSWPTMGGSRGGAAGLAAPPQGNWRPCARAPIFISIRHSRMEMKSPFAIRRAIISAVIYFFIEGVIRAPFRQWRRPSDTKRLPFCPRRRPSKQKRHTSRQLRRLSGMERCLSPIMAPSKQIWHPFCQQKRRPLDLQPLPNKNPGSAPVTHAHLLASLKSQLGTKKHRYLLNYLERCSGCLQHKCRLHMSCLRDVTHRARRAAQTAEHLCRIFLRQKMEERWRWFLHWHHT